MNTCPPTIARPLRGPAACLILALAVSADAAQSLYFGAPGGTVEVAGCMLPADAPQLTVECRIKTLIPNAQTVRLVSQWSDQGDQGRFHLSLDSAGQLVAGFRTAQNAVQTVTVAGPKPDGRWHHLAVTWNQGTATIFMDGRPAAMETVPDVAVLAYSRLPLTIGLSAAADSEPACYEGFIGDVSIWNERRAGTGTDGSRSQRPIATFPATTKTRVPERRLRRTSNG